MLKPSKVRFLEQDHQSHTIMDHICFCVITVRTSDRFFSGNLLIYMCVCVFFITTLLP